MEGLDGDCPVAVPEAIEARRELRHDRARREKAHVAVVVVGRDPKVDIAHVSTTDDRYPVVDGEDLVVHAVLQTSQAGHELGVAR